MSVYEFLIERTFKGHGGYTRTHSYQIVAKNEKMAYFKLGQNYPDLKGEYEVEVLSCIIVCK